ncbi:hypothetical protein MTR_6g023920 [Medicago truncatula]|uniref:Uncharacterized protein n=1 Tax=Medicago truncatula TaxID=3880 RepID=G7KNP8_MEDTR|nr:hypothetical protein MTR_6g023920 [Medicago truncatula]
MGVGYGDGEGKTSPRPTPLPCLDVEQVKIAIRSKEEFLVYKVSKQSMYISDHAEAIENLTVEDYDHVM